MKHLKWMLLAVCLVVGSVAEAQHLRREAFDLLNLDYPGLESVREACGREAWEEAATRLLDYYRHRTGIVHPDIDLNHLTQSADERRWADEALEHTFFVHYGYQPSFNYGKDIDWRYWPVQDNELRWQLHRHKWFAPMGVAYRLTGDEKYAREWVYQYMDWIIKNPLRQIDAEQYESISAGEVQDVAENVRFAWRPLEVSHRLEDQTRQFLLFVAAEAFTPEFLTEFLINYHRHALHILNNYSAQGNHLLFEAQRMVYAGAFFPELADAPAWRQSGIEILNREIGKQVYDDGGQFELDPHYHLASINIFCQALRMADVNGFRAEFPAEFVQTVYRMIEFYAHICYPDYGNPCFSDAKLGDREEEIANYRTWAQLFPDSAWIRWYATEHAEGEPLSGLSHGSLTSGFFTFRNGWERDATVMVVKAGPQGEWHCQPDNGTFELWFNGRNLFPDSGSYVYAGDSEVMKLRNWFRQTQVHNTLTLNGQNLQHTQSKTLCWHPDGAVQVLMTENPHYDGLKHRRTVFFVEGRYFVVVDEAVGEATGTVNVNYHLAEGAVQVDAAAHRVTTAYEGASNVVLAAFADAPMQVRESQGWRSTAYRHRVERTSVAFDVEKNSARPVRTITVIIPTAETNYAPAISARFLNKGYDEKGVKVEIRIDGQSRKLKCGL